jgi:uncharacterized iron-regulated protein
LTGSQMRAMACSLFPLRGVSACSFVLLVGASGCASLPNAPEAIAPVPGSIWDARAGTYVSTEVVQRAVRESNLVLLGETHDNLEHHRLQRELLGHILATGRRPALVMEQLDREFQAALDGERARAGRTADSVLDAAHFNRRGWGSDGYRPLVDLALQYELPLVAANVSRNDARAIVRDPAKAALPPVGKPVEDALAADIERSHCGQRPAPALLAGMVAAQRARDVAMAQALQKQAARGAVLIAGGGHVRVDRGAPLYLGERPLVVAFLEVDSGGKRALKDYLDDEFATARSFDFVWFTERATRTDPCADMPRMQEPPAAPAN